MQDTNYPSVSDLVGMKPQDIAELPSDALATLQKEIFDRFDAIKNQTSALNDGLMIKYADRAKQAYLEKGLDTGKAHIVDGDIGINLDVPKSVSWDQSGLRKALNNMSQDEARHYAKMKLEVPEAKFSSAPPNIKSIFAPLRTVKPGKMKIRFEQTED